MLSVLPGASDRATLPALLFTRYSTHEPSLTLSAHAVERSPFAPVILIACNARAQPWAWRDGHRAHQKVCMPCRAVLQAARSAHAERSLLFNSCNLRAPHILLRCVSCSLAACAQSSVQTQHRVLPMHEARVFQGAAQGTSTSGSTSRRSSCIPPSRARERRVLHGVGRAERMTKL